MWIHENKNWPNYTPSTISFINELNELQELVNDWNTSDDASKQAQFYDDLQIILTANDEKDKDLFRKFDKSDELNSYTEAMLSTSMIENENPNERLIRENIATGMKIRRRKRNTIKTADGRSINGMIDMVIDANENDADMTAERLQHWHQQLFPNEQQTSTWRSDNVWIDRSGTTLKTAEQDAVYKGPEPERVPDLMNSFIEWLNTSDLNPFLKVGTAHLVFEQIHPFTNGNGQIGRALCDYLLAKLNQRKLMFHSLTRQLWQNRTDYFLLLRRFGVCDSSDSLLDLTEWLRWFLKQIRESTSNAQKLIGTAEEKVKILTYVRMKNVNDRQLKVICRMLEPYWCENLTNSRYLEITKCSNRTTATRDITDLVDSGILVRNKGGGRSASYRLTTWNDIRQRRRAASILDDGTSSGTEHSLGPFMMRKKAGE